MIDQNKLIHLVNRVIGSKGRKLKKADEYMYWSPFVSHHKQKLQVNMVTGKWHCWVSNTGGHNLFQLFKKLKVTNEQFTELKEILGKYSSYKNNKINKNSKVELLELPSEFVSLSDKCSSPNYNHAISYLRKRDISREDILKYNIGYCESGVYKNRIIIPSYDENGNLNFFVGRDIYGSNMKYRNSPFSKDIIGFDLFINWDEPIILTEGPFDAMAIKRNAIPLFGKTISQKLRQKIIQKRVSKIYISLDNDAISDSIKMMEDFMRNHINVYFVNLPEKDPSDIGFSNIHKLLSNTVKTSFSDLIKYKLNRKTKRYINFVV